MPNRKYTIKCLPYFMSLLAECASDDLLLHWSKYPCLLWNRGCTKSGYGLIQFEGRLTRTNRLALQMTLGRELHDGELACHRCDVRACIRPIHLFAATQLDNVRDMMAKGRDNFLFKRRQPAVRRGEKHSHSILTEAQVIEIRSLAGRISQDQIAARYGVSRGAIKCVIGRATWTHI